MSHFLPPDILSGHKMLGVPGLRLLLIKLCMLEPNFKQMIWYQHSSSSQGVQIFYVAPVYVPPRSTSTGQSSFILLLCLPAQIWIYTFKLAFTFERSIKICLLKYPPAQGVAHNIHMIIESAQYFTWLPGSHRCVVVQQLQRS